MTLPVEVVTGREQPSVPYSPSKITLYGIPMPALAANIGSVTQVPTKPAMVNVIIPICDKVQFYSALIYAYAFQGHCYHLPEPTILVVQGALTPAVGFGFDQFQVPAGGGPPVNQTSYFMWVVEKLDRTMQLEMTSDTFEEIVLKRGLTGTKQPLSYATRFSVSHRGGKLME
jgi:hypothetical protein